LVGESETHSKASTESHERASGDLGLGAWITRYVPDRRIRTILLVCVSVLLIASLAARIVGTIGSAVEILLLVLILFFCCLFMLVATVAVFPIDEKATEANVRAAERTQRNARVNLAVLSASLLCVACALYLFVVPIWDELRFNIEMQRLSWGLIDLNEFFLTAGTKDLAGESVSVDNMLDEDDHNLPFNNTGAVTDVPRLLRLIAQRRAAIVNGIIKLPSLPSGHVLILAAKSVRLSAKSVINIGSTSLVIIASDLEIEPDASVVSFLPDDVPSNAGLSYGKGGRPGGDSGSLRIIVLNSINGSGKASIDLRGQQGGQGAPGAKPAPRPSADDKQIIAGRPQWVFRQLTDDELKRVEAELDVERPYLMASEGGAQVDHLSSASLARCEKNPVTCVAIVCAEDLKGWAAAAAGPPGDQGERGGKGGQGGDSGSAGTLSIFYLPTGSLTDETVDNHFEWVDHIAISSAPPSRPGGESGEGGKGGAGGAGGRGLAADPFGACPSGVAGNTGSEGLAGEPGGSGRSSVGKAGTSIHLSPLF
jgi:hypothetical protein